MFDLDRHEPDAPTSPTSAADAGAPEPEPEPLRASKGALTGTVGDVTPTGPADVRAIEETGDALSFELHFEHLEGRVMHVLRLGTSFDELTTGEHTSATMSMSVLGCSGPPDTDWVYDELTRDVDLRVSEPVAGTLQLDWTAHFPETPYYGDPSRTAPAQQSTGSVLLHR